MDEVVSRLFSLLVLLTMATNASVFAQAPEAANCVNCHKEQVKQWQVSDHAKAMDHATNSSVFADFDNSTIKHFTQTAHFFKNGSKFFAKLTEGGVTTTFPITYVFGHYPLQQYLVETQTGQFQVFPFAWDTRDKKEGGQRWYPNYPSEDMAINDRLHWKQPLQNWNGMCADCHSSGLKRNFDTDTLSFNSQFDEINVSCKSCHGDVLSHTVNNNSDFEENDTELSHLSGPVDESRKKFTIKPHSLSQNEQKSLGKWLLKEGSSIASWHEKKDGEFVPASRNNSFMDTCFACHSLRSALTDGIEPQQPFLDQFSPSLLISPLYFADGQIREEVYVYGSFLQSRMYDAGVNCIDCHSPHSMKLKIEGNGLCLQCHSVDTFQGEIHSKHTQSEEANQCINCHMPSRTYMGVDARRDHSFSIPTPHISAKTDAPNACINCHDKDNAWVSKQLIQWYGRDSTLSSIEEDYVSLMHGNTFSNQAILRIAHSASLPVIKRATALTMLPSTNQPLNNKDLRHFIQSKEPLIRLAAAQAGRALPLHERMKTYVKLLDDEYRAIRIAAANNLIGSGLKSKSFSSALSELTLSNKINQWRGEGSLNQSLVEYKLGNVGQAEELLKQGIIVDPYFEASYINLAEFYRAQHKTQLEKQILLNGAENMPKSDLFNYALGMFYIRNQDKPTALTYFKKATALAPDKPQNWYVYALALDSIGETETGVSILKNAIITTPDSSLIKLGLSLSRKLGDEDSTRFFQSKIRQ
ncbi:ammonia-forming cytochrome c nitrite reductase subunit c552 [Alteromonas portus]|uniref:Ammonia-forming cytochrome c nitrite reductase subunit c552 n=1 Tax=Alteromonas portus TaxID=2565549 RepID=A0A4U0ZHD3_9ALTE|nr:multiheme c-type cytochrome [Alteromonas portus]TKB02430.1 ammonia-forming cytochrome c nitrite reductase subunit c552 [Alteromonas portus]